MKPVDQDMKHRLEDGHRGMCLRACVASILELPLEDVPHFGANKPTATQFYNRLYDWLEARGYSYHFVTRKRYIDRTKFYIISGPSPRGQGTHAVVGKGLDIEHDPHPSRAGLEGSASVWSWIELIKE